MRLPLHQIDCNENNWIDITVARSLNNSLADVISKRAHLRLFNRSLRINLYRYTAIQRTEYYDNKSNNYIHFTCSSPNTISVVVRLEFRKEITNIWTSSLVDMWLI